MTKTTNKMVIVMRKDLQMTKGKYVAQGSHAALGLFLKISREQDAKHLKILHEWIDDSFTKITLGVESEEELLELYEKAKEVDLPTLLITDNGATMFHGIKTNTCIAILGDSEAVNQVTGHLKLL